MRRESLLMSSAFLCVAMLAAVPASAAEKDEKLPRAEVKPDAALIYVARPAGVGFAVPMYFFANEQFLGMNHGNGYFWAYLPPGKYIFWSKAENVNAIPEMEVEAGKTYYFWQKTVPGWIKARTAVELVDSAQGDSLIDDCQKHSELTDKQRERGEEDVKQSWARAQKEAAEAAAEPVKEQK